MMMNDDVGYLAHLTNFTEVFYRPNSVNICVLLMLQKEVGTSFKTFFLLILSFGFVMLFWVGLLDVFVGFSYMCFLIYQQTICKQS